MSRTIAVCLDGAEPALAADLARIAAGRPEPLSLAEVLELCERAEDIRLAMTGQTRARSGSVLLGRAVRVGGATLRSLSLGGAIALRRLVSWASMMDQEIYDVVEAWIYAHSWSCAELARLTDPMAAAELVEEWAPRLTCTTEDLAAAVEALTEPAPAAASGKAAAGPADDRRILDSLMVRYGGSEVRWLETPICRINALADAAAANERQRESELARAQGTLPPAANDERVNAVAAYARTRARLAGQEANPNG